MKARKLELKTLPFEIEVEGVMRSTQFDYRAELLSVLTSGGERGFSCDDVLKAVDVKASLKAANGALLLSSEDHAWLVKRLNATPWRFAHDAVADFIKDVRDAPQVEVEAPKDETGQD